MKPKIIQQGAEATIYRIGKNIEKNRLEKSYRLPLLDKAIRKRRTKKERKLLLKASSLISTPIPVPSTEISKIIMPYISGKKLSKYIDKFSNLEKKKICNQIGENIAKLHDNDIIHGDLTTSNMILSKNKVWFIDFGLGYESYKIEDKAVDLHLIKQALEAKHYENFENYWKSILQGYKSSKNYSETIKRLKIVESRGRYKDKY